MKNYRIVNIFKPIYIIGVIFFTRKFTLIDSNVSKVSVFYIIYAIFGNIMIYLMFFHMFNSFFELLNNNSLYFFYVIVYFLFSFNHTVISALNIINSENHIKVMLNLQKIQSILGDSRDSKFIYIVIRVSLFALFTIFLILISIKLISDRLSSFSRGILIFLTTVSDVELLNAAFVMLFLSRYVDQWLRRMSLKIGTISLRDMIKDETDERERMFQVFRTIIDTAINLEQATNVTILSHFVTQLIQSLSYIRILILWMHSERKEESVEILSHFIGVLIWITKGFLIETILCVCCEIYYRKIVFARTVVLIYKGHSFTYSDRKLTKRILSDISTRFRRMDCLGLFTLEAALLLKLLALLAHYTVVLLQFVF
ncbi:uncharacterized protein LOC116775210 [Danaus plexippus]|uniref:uncharacterized protein LOC116775210 n=1 Tax=Danaus plexippus TaxID=13037 RepID=UPI002AB23467|nr:uncharacterized protein LOC116775210 [Danaus plexippus]